jgi:hypothetical protein
MLLVLLLMLLALLPLAFTSAFSQLMLVSIYAGLAHILALLWVTLLLMVAARRQRVADWRRLRARPQLAADQAYQS